MDHFKELPGPRINRTKHHELCDILVIAICTLLCGGTSFYDMELWEGLRSVGMVEITRIIGDKETMERRYFLSSPELEPKTLPCRMVPRVSVWCS